MTQPRCRRIRLDVACAAAAALVVLRSPPVRAEDPGNAAAAQGLFDEARALMAAGQAAEACPKLEESQRLDPGSGTLMNLARCYEQTNRIATAWSTYQALSDKQDAARACQGTSCSSMQAAASGNDAHAAGNITTVAVVVAAAGITAGLTLWFTAPTQASTAVTVGLGHVTLAGAF